MEKENVQEKNIVTTRKDKIKFIYVPKKGIIAQSGKGDNIAFFQFEKNIESLLKLSHIYLEGIPEYPECTEAYSFFDDGVAFWVSKKDRNILSRIRCDTSFVFKGYELIQMEYEKFINLKLLFPDFIQYDYYFPGPKEYFRYYTLYYFCKYQLVFFVWRKKIRMVIMKDSFFKRKKSQKYLEKERIRKVIF